VLLLKDMRASLTGIVALVLLAAACGRPGPGARNAEMGRFRAVGVGASADPTVHPARLLPEAVDERTMFGSEPGGGSRVIMAGLRVVTSPKGAIVAADDTLPSAPQSTVQLPDRLGGGFLFVIGSTLWRADRWLGTAKPIFTSLQAVQAIIPGLDRVYVRSPNAVLAIDGRTGQVLDLGPWPASPYVASYAAADGWRAAAVTDMRGVVATFDAGATWRPLDLPIDAKQVALSNDSLAIGGVDGGRSETWYELRADGSVARLGAAPRDVKTKFIVSTPPRPTNSAGVLTPPGPPPRPIATATTDAEKDDLAAKTFGKRPLATAIEDGWPLTDGTAVIARDGALARVRLSDGTLTEHVRDAFPLKTARCHPVTLTRPNAVGAFGFVCGEPRGTTVVYAYEPLRGRLAEIKRFDKPRVVTSSGNGALAVRGPCAEDGDPTPPPRPEPAKLERNEDRERSKAPTKAGEKAKEDGPENGTPLANANETDESKAPEPKAFIVKEPPRAPASEAHPYCVLGHDNTWREIHVRGDVGGERVVVLADGRIVVVSPPQGLGTPARITILDPTAGAKEKTRATTLPVTFPRVANDVGRALRLGLWLDGFEERRPGVVGGWIEAGGAMLGIELGLDGKATVGQFIRDAGMPFVSGRYGLGWTASRRGYETTDGGMTWSNIDLPAPLVPIAKVERRACGPVGCLAHGWLRVGWGESNRPPLPTAPPPYRSASGGLTVPHVQLACEPMATAPPTAPAPKPKSSPATSPTPSRIHLGGLGSAPVLGSFNGLQELPPFFSQAAPILRDSERGINIDVRELLERYPNTGSLARVYGWGPRIGEWETLGHWQVKWLSPFSGWPEVRASLPATPPQIILDSTRATTSYFGGYGISNNSFQLTPGDDPSHALLVGKRVVRPEVVAYELEADRVPVEIRRADGEPFGEIESIVRAAGRWYVATPLGAGSASPVTVIWQAEGGIARELVRIPRTTNEALGTARTKLARRTDGRAIALIVDGQQSAERSTNVRWALPIDLESGALGEPEALGYVDLAGRTLEACTDDVVGWVLDTSMPSSSVRLRLPHGSGSLLAVFARLRLTSTRTCIERLAGNYDGQSQESAAQLTRAGVSAPARNERTRSTTPLRPGELVVTAMSMQTRYPLRCSTQGAATK
jgi:hypothetical protein